MRRWQGEDLLSLWAEVLEEEIQLMRRRKQKSPQDSLEKIMPIVLKRL